MIKLYVAEIRNLQDPKENSALLEGLAKYRQEKILRYKYAMGRIQSLGAGLLLKKVLNEYRIPQDSIKIGKNGKPEAEGFHFNLSHTDGLVICVVGKKAVGCDVEKIKKASTEIAKRYFTDSEISYLRECSNEVFDREFFRIWTTKEAYMKMTGEGMSLGLNHVEVCFYDEKISVWREGKKADCYVKEYDIPGYKITVCSEEKEFAEEIVQCDLT